MDKENKFIPCGDSMEKMEEISDDKLESIAGGLMGASQYRTSPKCGKTRMSQTNDFFCETCNLEF